MNAFVIRVDSGIVYTIAYGASTSTSDCTTDSGTTAISPCDTLKDMSSGYTVAAPNNNTGRFYSDDGPGGDCPTLNSGPTDLPTIFSNIESSFGIGRLIPNS